MISIICALLHIQQMACIVYLSWNLLFCTWKSRHVSCRLNHKRWRPILKHKCAHIWSPFIYPLFYPGRSHWDTRSVLPRSQDSSIRPWIYSILQNGRIDGQLRTQTLWSPLAHYPPITKFMSHGPSHAHGRGKCNSSLSIAFAREPKAATRLFAGKTDSWQQAYTKTVLRKLGTNTWWINRCEKILYMKQQRTEGSHSYIFNVCNSKANALNSLDPQKHDLGLQLSIIKILSLSKIIAEEDWDVTEVSRKSF